MGLRPRHLLALAPLAGACAEPEQPDDTEWHVERTCLAPPGLGSPETIDEAVALVNALPMPVSLACVLEALDRPLAVVAATSPFSAQPTEDLESPRMFLFSGALVMSIVTTGEARAYLEFGQYIEDGRTLKGELEFPVAEPLVPSAPYAQVLFGEQTACSLCHGGERFEGRVDEVPMYSSYALAPEPERLVSVGFVAAHARNCERELDAGRCDMFESVFAHGDVGATAFDDLTRICFTP